MTTCSEDTQNYRRDWPYLAVASDPSKLEPWSSSKWEFPVPSVVAEDTNITSQPHNVIIQTTLADKIAKWVGSKRSDLFLWKPQNRPSSLDVQFVDYDGVRFHLSTPERKTVLLLSMHIRCWAELVRYGANEVLNREYGALMKGQAESEYNVSLEIDLEQAPTEGGEYATHSEQRLITQSQ